MQAIATKTTTPAKKTEAAPVTLCVFCRHRHDFPDTHCQAHAQDGREIKGVWVVLDCAGYEAREGMSREG